MPLHLNIKYGQSIEVRHEGKLLTLRLTKPSTSGIRLTFEGDEFEIGPVIKPNPEESLKVRKKISDEPDREA